MHVYSGVDGLQDKPLVGKGDCVELVIWVMDQWKGDKKNRPFQSG